MPTLRWQKSSYSAEGSNCVEIASTATTVHIRDSKNPDGPHLTLQSTTWMEFLSTAWSRDA
ncbi:DUF397 domain-containing protein [Streptomyces sp. NPDC012474]|uniref:DUF397 domain-containing protein n=1 Tax=Streptomyces sp. NPDC012474 TaxID=3364836 RepID=UPI0036E71E1B